MSRKVSVRLPDALWNWLSARGGDRQMSAAIVDCLEAIKTPTEVRARRIWVWAAAASAIALALIVIKRYAKRAREPDACGP